MFRHYLETLSRFRENEDDPLCVRVLVTLKEEIQRDLVEAFELGEPFVEEHPRLYDESTSFVDFLFKLLEVEREQKREKKKKKIINRRRRRSTRSTSYDDDDDDDDDESSLKILCDAETGIRNTVEKLNLDIGEVLKRIDHKYQTDKRHFDEQNEALKTYLGQFSGTMRDFNAMFSELRDASKKFQGAGGGQAAISHYPSPPSFPTLTTGERSNPEVFFGDRGGIAALPPAECPPDGAVPAFPPPATSTCRTREGGNLALVPAKGIDSSKGCRRKQRRQAATGDSGRSRADVHPIIALSCGDALDPDETSRDRAAEAAAAAASSAASAAAAAREIEELSLEKGRLNTTLSERDEKLRRLEKENEELSLLLAREKTATASGKEKLREKGEIEKDRTAELDRLKRDALRFETDKIHFEQKYSVCEAKLSELRSKSKRSEFESESKIQDLNRLLSSKNEEADENRRQERKLRENFEQETDALRKRHGEALQRKEREISDCQRSLDAKNRDIEAIRRTSSRSAALLLETSSSNEDAIRM